MDPYEEKLKAWIAAHGISAEVLHFEQSCHSVAEAAAAAGAQPTDFVKSICLIAPDGALAVAIVKGEDKADMRKVGALLGVAAGAQGSAGAAATKGHGKVRPANPEEMIARTGYLCGGTPPFGYAARFFVDPRVLEKALVLAGGGNAHALLRIAPAELLRANNGTVAEVRR